MTDTPQIPLPPEVVQQLAMGHIIQGARENLAFDIPRQWATMITMNVDDANGIIILTFREGVNLTVQGQGAPETVQELSRNVVSIAMPRGVVEQFVQGAGEHFNGTSETNG